MQYEKNKEYFEKNRVIYENSARKLVQQLRIFVETQKEQSVELARYGTIYAPKVWQAVYLGNPRVFEKKEEKEWALDPQGFKKVSDDTPVDITKLDSSDKGLYYKDEPYTTKKLH